MLLVVVLLLPLHGHADLPKGLFRKVIREDPELEEFIGSEVKFRWFSGMLLCGSDAASLLSP